MTRSRRKTIEMFWRATGTDEECAEKLGLTVDEVQEATREVAEHTERAVTCILKHQNRLPCALHEVAAIVGLTHEGVRKAEQRALEKMRAFMEREAE